MVGSCLTLATHVQKANSMHVVAEASYDNLFDSDQNTLFDPFLQEKIVYVVPSAAKLLSPRLGIFEWLSENLNGQSPDKALSLPSNWIRTEPRALEAQFK